MSIKSEKIKQSLRKTRIKRKLQICKSYEVKVDKSHLSKSTLEKLNKIFLEAKWFYNYILATNDISKFSCKINSAIVKLQDGTLENRDIKILSGQMKQGIINRVNRNILSLARLKDKGYKIGRLKFRKEVNSVPLNQFNKTFKIRNNKYIHIQNIGQDIKVSGLEQIPQDCDISDALLIKRNIDFYIKITCWINKDKIKMQNDFGSIGIDFGIKTQLVFSNGIRLNFQLEESKRLKRIQSRISRIKSDTHNKRKLRVKFRKLHQKLIDQKKDIRNKIVSHLKNNYSFIAIQDENIKGWHSGRYGKAVQHSNLGGIKGLLKDCKQTTMIKRSFPSTKLCPICGTLNPLSLSERTYSCECGYSGNRDVHAARNILNEALSLQKIPMEYRELTPEETETSVLHMRSAFSKIPYVRVSLCR